MANFNVSFSAAPNFKPGFGAPNFKPGFGSVQEVNKGGVAFQTDETLKLENGILSVNTTDLMEQDNTLPITSAGVFATVGNIEALLKTI